MENITQGQWFRGPSADLGAPIDQSLRFNGSEELKRSSVRSASNAAATISVWVKLGILNTSMRRILTIETSGGSWGLGLVYNSNKIWVYDSTTTDGNASQSDGVLRDPSAWYHIVYNRSAGGTDQELYINGVLQNASASFTTSVDLFSIRHEIGGRDGDPTTSWEGYLADFHFVDGSKLDPTSFGKTNGDGVWVPINYSGGHGSMGYYLPFDSSADGGIGDDASTNADDFTATGFETTAISSSNFDNDIDYLDTPTSNYATLNPLVPANLDLARANLTTSYNTVNIVGNSTIAVKDSGKYYWEIETDFSTAYNVVGIGAPGATDWIPGPSIVWTSSSSGIIQDEGDFTASNNTVTTPYVTGDILGWALDLDGNSCEVFQNGTSRGTFDIDVGDHFVAPIVGNSNASPTTHSNSINYGQRPFIYTVPTGFSALQTNNLPEPTIKNGKDHFDIVTFTNSTSGNTITGLNFQPDLVWIKVTNQAYSHRLHDSIRGVQNYLISNGTAVEQTSQSDSLLSFTSDGFTTGNLGQANGDTNVAWCWKAGTSYTPTVTGFTNPTASINTEAGFGIYTFTGNNTASSFTHGLDSTPEIIIAKNRTTASDWAVFGPTGSSSTPTPTDTYERLNETTDANKNGTQILTGNTSTTVSVASFGDTAGNDNYVYYLWHSVEGFSKMGRYTGNGSTDGPVVYTGFKPAFLLLRRNGGTANWMIFDSARDTQNPCFKWLEANEAAQEQNNQTAYHVDFLSNGFKLRGAGRETNLSASDNYIYMAFAENPFGGGNTAPATAR